MILKKKKIPSKKIKFLRNHILTMLLRGESNCTERKKNVGREKKRIGLSGKDVNYSEKCSRPDAILCDMHVYSNEKNVQ